MTAIAPPHRGTVLTFYSYKGGTGRTMALANVACLLAREHAVGRPVLMMDWDFEAPGLHTFFEKRIPDAARTHYESAPGMIDLLDNAFRMLRELPEPAADAEDATADAFVAGMDLAGATIDAGVPNLQLIKAGRFDDHYAGTVNGFDWEALYQRAPWLFPALARRLERDYAFTLVDSRTGLTDTSGICTMLMPERLVVVFTPGRQSLTGLSGLTQRAIQYRRLSSDLRPLAVFPLPSRIESSEDDLRTRWRRATPGDMEVGTGYQPLFENMFHESYGLDVCSLESYFDAVVVLHHAKSAYGERIAVEDDKSSEVVSPSASYRRFTDRLLELANPWEDLDRVRELRRIGDLVSHALRAIESAAPSAETASAAITVLSQAADALSGMATSPSAAQTSSSPPLCLEDPGVADAFRFVAAQSGTPLGLRIQALTRAVDVDTMTVGAEHPKLIAPLRHLAEKQREARDLPAARSSAERALAIAEANLAKNDSRLADLLSYIGELRLAVGDTVGSDAVLERARAIRGEHSTATPVPRAYLDWLRNECASVELLGLRVKQGHAIRLNSVYVPLTTTAPTEDSKAGKARLTPEAREHEPARPTLLLDRTGRESLYVTGAPGAGKSTFCRWLAWLVCEGGVPSSDVEPPDEFRETLPLALVGRLPLLVPLRSVWSALPAHGELAPFDLEATIAAWFTSQKTPALGSDVIHRHMAQGSALLMLDGVDEVPAIPRERLVTALERALPEWKGRGNRVLITSRPYGLDEASVQRLQLNSAPILPMADALQELLVQRWFRILVDDIFQADATAVELRRQVKAQAWLEPLMESPLLLTSMCIVFGEGKRLPEDKHELYDRVVDAVLYHRIPERSREQLVRARLAVVAYSMHTGEGIGPARNTPQAEATYEEIDHALRSYQERSGWSEKRDRTVEDDREELVGSTGICLPRGEGRAGFLHLSFQEFLAAQRLADVESSDLFEAVRSRMSQPEWRNTLSFVVGSVLATGSSPERAVRLVMRMVDEADRTGGGSALVAADAWEILTRREVSLGSSVDAKVRSVIERTMLKSKSARERCDAGKALASVGDRRFSSDRWFLPLDDTLGFRRVEAGSFLMGSDKAKDKNAFDDEVPQHPVDLPEFHVGQYLVTVAQFKTYSEAAKPALRDPTCVHGVANHPVVNITWHEAMAYCRWLTERLRTWSDPPREVATWLHETVRAGGVVRLPSEAEWEKAARGTTGLVYPWGSEFDADKANVDDTGIGGTSTVGAFPGGQSPYGALDMSGNVWEWTQSLWGEDAARPQFRYPYVADDGREQVDVSDKVHRVVRGGSFDVDDHDARAAFRLRYLPDDWFGDLGFRVVVSCSRS